MNAPADKIQAIADRIALSGQDLLDAISEGWNISNVETGVDYERIEAAVSSIVGRLTLRVKHIRRRGSL